MRHEYKQAKLDMYEKISDNAWPFLPQEQRAASEGVLHALSRLNLKLKLHWLRVKHKVSWDRVWNRGETSVAVLLLDDKGWAQGGAKVNFLGSETIVTVNIGFGAEGGATRSLSVVRQRGWCQRTLHMCLSSN